MFLFCKYFSQICYNNPVVVWHLLHFQNPVEDSLYYIQVVLISPYKNKKYVCMYIYEKMPGLWNTVDNYYRSPFTTLTACNDQCDILDVKYNNRIILYSQLHHHVQFSKVCQLRLQSINKHHYHYQVNVHSISGLSGKYMMECLHTCILVGLSHCQQLPAE